ncbi:MAG: aldehyde dehydrogenase [Clostridia bacterium]|nr:aldehyde dehydrogenase [Clostridia bacterium]
MEESVLYSILESQREYFLSGATLPYSFRKKMLQKLYDGVIKYKDEVLLALKSDLGKCKTEAYMCEVGLVLSEISYLIKNLKKFMAKSVVKTPIAQFKAKSYSVCSPYGNVLIMSPWNYPFLLTIEPLADAIAAGNTAMVKPSAYSPATSEVIKNMLEDCFLPNYVGVVTGGRKENACLLKQKFDFVFFTGSQNVGKEVLRNCAEHLTPAILELGGKSPCIVDESAKIELSAKRIVFGKFINCGQTCVAPDYILCHESIKNELIGALCKQIVAQFGENALENENYGKIINQKHFDRIVGLINSEKVVIGGGSDAEKLKIQPTILDNVSFDDAVMQEEIFGPILPIITYKDFSELKALIQKNKNPLALYIFSENKAHIEEITNSVSFGGGCVNDVIIHLATSELGFGGVGESGMGSYHGKIGFEAFSHRKSIVDKATFMDLPMRYQPYTDKKAKMITKFLK